MSFSSLLKEELFLTELENIDEMYAELFGILNAKNSIKENEIHFTTENVSLAKRVYSNLLKLTKLNIQIKYLTSKKLGIHNIYVIILKKNKGNKKSYMSFLENLYLCKNFDVINDEKKVSSIIRGFFLTSGYVKSPEKGYALDFFLDTEDSATFLFYLLKKMGKKVFQTDKKNKSLVYLRNSENILDIIYMIGAINSFFKFQEITVNKEIRNKINRNINWEIANETKKQSTSEKQVKIIESIDNEIGLEELTGALKEAAQMRLEHRDLSLQELADMMNISKSGIRNRFRRLEEIYTKLYD